jgi:hypothetical protein
MGKWKFLIGLVKSPSKLFLGLCLVKSTNEVWLVNKFISKDNVLGSN